MKNKRSTSTLNIICSCLSILLLVGGAAGVLSLAAYILGHMQLDSDEIRSAAKQYEEISGQELTDLNSLVTPFNDKEGHYHGPLLNDSVFQSKKDLSKYRINPTTKMIVNKYDQDVNSRFFSSSIIYKKADLNNITQKYNCSLQDLLPVQNMQINDLMALIHWMPMNTTIRFPVSKVKLVPQEVSGIIFKDVSPSYIMRLTMKDEQNNDTIVTFDTLCRWNKYQVVSTIIKKDVKEPIVNVENRDYVTVKIELPEGYPLN